VKRKPLLIGIVLIAATVSGWALSHRGGPDHVVLTGIVTTSDVVVSPQVTGRVSRLLVGEGSPVEANQLIATLEPAEMQADRAYFALSADALTSQVQASEADLAATVAQQREAQATLDNAKKVLDRYEVLLKSGGLTPQEVEAARTQFDVAQARVSAADKQVANRRSAVQALKEQQAAARAQTTKADVRLRYLQITAPITGTVDVRAAREGEVVAAGQPIVTLVNPDSLWVRADVEESYIDAVRLGDTLTVVLPSGAKRSGVVFYRGVDADYATQRDVSRIKRDVKTFEIRLRVNNTDRRLAVGMTATVMVPISAPGT
jgi:HlyD family secretion protein